MRRLHAYTMQVIVVVALGTQAIEGVRRSTSAAPQVQGRHTAINCEHATRCSLLDVDRHGEHGSASSILLILKLIMPSSDRGLIAFHAAPGSHLRRRESHKSLRKVRVRCAIQQVHGPLTKQN